MLETWSVKTITCSKLHTRSFFHQDSTSQKQALDYAFDSDSDLLTCWFQSRETWSPLWKTVAPLLQRGLLLFPSHITAAEARSWCLPQTGEISQAIRLHPPALHLQVTRRRQNWASYPWRIRKLHHQTRKWTLRCKEQLSSQRRSKNSLYHRKKPKARRQR